MNLSRVPVQGGPCQKCGTEIYRIEAPAFENRYYVLSNESTRHLMESPEVVGFDSYTAMVRPTVDALSYLRSCGFNDDVNILTILRGGLNYPLEECCHKVGLQVNNINFLSCERIIRKGVITGLDIKYDKLRVIRDCTLMIGDIVASGDTLRLCMKYVVDHFKSCGGSIKRVVFFTIGGTRAFGLMEELTVYMRSLWPDFEGFSCFFYEGVFTVYEDKGVTGVNIPMIDFGWRGGIVSPEFRKHIVSLDNALFEKCIIYDGGARRYEISAHCEEVLEYWQSLRDVADKSDMTAFVAEKIGYDGFPSFDEWGRITGLELLPDMEKLYELEMKFVKKACGLNLKGICERRIAEFAGNMEKYN